MAMIEIDRSALRDGVALAGIITVPLALGYWLIVGDSASDDNASRPAVLLFSLAVIVGLTLGAIVAAQRQKVGAPLAHGILAALTLWLVLSAIRLVRLALSSDPVTWSPVISNLLLALITGTIGGLIGNRRAIKRAREGGSS